MSIDASTTAKSHNWGLSVLKCLLALCVVFLHFGHGNSPYAPSWSVPAFMIVSFYLMGRLWAEPSWPALRKRLLRLAWPFFAWGAIYWVANGIFTGEFSLRALFWQLVVGHTVCMPLYFLFLLMLFTTLIVCSLFMTRERTHRLFFSLTIVSLCWIAQYSDINAMICNAVGDAIPELRYPIGRIAELLPAALLGILLSKEKHSATITQKPRRAAGIGCLLFILGFILSNTLITPKGFMYQGIPIFLEATGITIFFLSIDTYLQPFSRVCKILRVLANVTLGIYCMHWMVGFFMRKICGLECGIPLTIIVYLISAICALILSRLPLSRKIVS